MPDIYHVIMAGGSGTRFWPASRRSRPKQFLSLSGEASLIRQTFDRCAASGPAGRILVSAGEEHRAGVIAALPELPDSRFIGEPVARNTAPAVGLSALRLSLMDPGAIAVFCPADHVYSRPGAYAEAIATAAEVAAAGDHLVTLGIRPARPETGYGYIEAGEAGASGSLRALRFIEKPDAATASTLAGSGRHFWNAGVFVWRVASILDAIRRHHPILHDGLERIRAALGPALPEAADDPLARPAVRSAVREVFASQPSISIDYAVMEKARNVLVVPCDAGWSDVGSWDAVAELGAPDDAGNVLDEEVLAIESSGNLVRSGGKVIALVGVSDLIVVDAGDALLICRRGSSQKVRDVVAALSRRGRPDLL
ncbi:MAG: mannose-1-phosphate guanylyltransferase [Acidobacteria bacterium]|nr:mannose-1-phosphate guanylyltransferase [Acidobacteriota bacterium]